MIDWTPLARDVLDALAEGPIDPNTRVRLVRAAAIASATSTHRVFAFEILKEPTWKDRGRACRARLALREPRLQDRLMIVVSLKVLELVDEIGAMTGHERIRLSAELWRLDGAERQPPLLSEGHRARTT